MEKIANTIVINQIATFENILPSEIQQTIANFLDRLNLTALSLSCKKINGRLKKTQDTYTKNFEKLITTAQTKDLTGNDTIKILLQCARLATNTQLDSLLKDFFNIVKDKTDIDKDSFIGFFIELLNINTHSSFKSLILFLSINYLHINKKIYDKNIPLLVSLRTFLFKQLETSPLNFFIINKIDYFFNVLREISSCAEFNSIKKLKHLQSINSWLFQSLTYSNKFLTSNKNILEEKIIDIPKDNFLKKIIFLIENSSVFFTENVFDCSFCNLDLQKNDKIFISKFILERIKNVKFIYNCLNEHAKIEFSYSNKTLHLFDKAFFDELINQSNKNNEDLIHTLLKKWRKRLKLLNANQLTCKLS